MCLKSQYCTCLPGATSTTFNTLDLEIKHSSFLLLVQHDSEFRLLTEGTWLPVSDDPTDAALTKVLPTATGQVGVPGHVQAQGTLELFDVSNEATLKPADITRGNGHGRLMFF